MEQSHHATRAVLDHPEILRRILDNLIPRRLCSPARVCKRWFEVATDILWYEISPDHLELVEPSRQQLYADKIQAVEVTSHDMAPDSPFKDITHLKFPKLKYIDFCNFHSADVDYELLVPFENPAPSILFMMECTLGAAFLDYVAKTWPNIREITLSDIGAETSAAGMVRLISAYPALTRVDLQDLGQLTVMDDIFLHCARNSSELQTLVLGDKVTAAAAEKAMSGESLPFSKLKTLDIRMSREGFTLLTPCLERLTSLTLEASDGNSRNLHSVAKLTALQVLRVYYAEYIPLARSDVMALTALENLKVLHLHCADNAGAECTEIVAEELDFMDRDLQELVSHLPLLHDINFGWDCIFTSKALDHLSDYCPELRSCTLPADIDFAGLRLDDRGGCAFPKLRDLSLGSLYVPLDKSAPSLYPDFDFEGAISSHFPRLVSFTLDNMRGCPANVFERFAVATKANGKEDDRQWRARVGLSPIDDSDDDDDDGYEYGDGYDEWEDEESVTSDGISHSHGDLQQDVVEAFMRALSQAQMQEAASANIPADVDEDEDDNSSNNDNNKNIDNNNNKKDNDDERDDAETVVKASTSHGPANLQQHSSRPLLTINQPASATDSDKEPVEPSLNPVSRALAQPHIVQAICEHVPLLRLGVVAQVNRQWLDAAIKIKWEEGDLDILRRRIQPTRRQHYASRIRTLAISHNCLARHDGAFAATSFNNLRLLVLDPTIDVTLNPTGLDRYMLPSIEDLVVASSWLNAAFFSTMQTRCPKLRKLVLSLSPTHPICDLLTKFIAAMPRLEHLELEGMMMTDDISAELAVQCARQPNLKFLSTPPSMQIPEEAFQLVASQVQQPFPSLERMLACVPSMALPLFGKWFTNVFELVLNVVDVKIPVLEHVSRMTALKRIRIRFPDGYMFTKAEIMSLRSLPSLEDLNICSVSHDGVVDEFPLTTDEFAEWIACFPNMKEMEMDVPMPTPFNTDKAFVTAAKVWPKLVRCVWPTGVDFSEIGLDTGSPPVFPNLMHLTLQTARTSQKRNKMCLFPR